MKTIYKYPIDNGSMMLELHKGFKILTVQTQNGTPYIWVLQDINTAIVTCKFLIVGTGEEIEEDLSKIEYIGTYQIGMWPRDILVYHLFRYCDEASKINRPKPNLHDTFGITCKGIKK